MIPAARIQAVIELVSEVIDILRPADTLASAYFRDRRFIGSKDRAAIANRLYRIMREYHRLAWHVKQAGCDVNARTMVIAAVVLDKEHSAKSLDSAFSGEKYTPDVLSEEEERLAKSLEGKSLDAPEMSLRERVECPEWAFPLLQKDLGDEFEHEMKAMLSAAPLDVRVNALKATREEILAELKQDDLEFEACKISPLGIRIYNRPPMARHPLFQDGCFEIQDEGSQMVALVANAKPGEQVVDFCAGAGGKTLALGASMNNKGRIVAMDVLGGRLFRAKERFRRAGLHNVETRELTSERDKFVKRHVGHFDLVLTDAPCTGTGTWRRDPDKRWRQLGPSISELLVLQKSILESAYRMVKPGGRLVYATCSLLKDENEHQVEAFLAAHPEFKVKPVREILPYLPDTGDYLRLTPAQHDTDGFFAAVMVRQ